MNEEIVSLASCCRRKPGHTMADVKWVLVFKVLALSLAMALCTGCLQYRARPMSAPVVESQYRARTVDNAALRKFAQSAGWKQWPPSILDLNALALIADYYSPDLDVARSQIAIADAAVVTARARINPSLSAGGGYNSLPEAPAIYDIVPSFTIETAGKRGYRTLQAENDADAVRLSFAQARWLLWSNLRSALIGYLAAKRRLDLLTRQSNLRNEIVEMLNKRLSVGAASQPEVDLYRVNLLQSEAAREIARGEAAQRRVALATAVGLPPQALGNEDVEYRALDQPPPDISLSLHNVERAGLLHRIDVRRMLVEYAAAEAGLRLEIARQYPDIQIAPDYGFEEAAARYTFSGIAAALPIFNHNQGLIHAAEARREQVEARFRALQSQAIGEMNSALALYQSALHEWRQESERVSTLQIQREQSARRALAAGQGDRLSLALAQLETNTAALAQLDALVRVQTDLGLLENSVQQPLEAGVLLPKIPEQNPRHEVIH